LRQLELFLTERLGEYDHERNLPHHRGTSELSAYLHFGQIGPLTVALAVQSAEVPQPAKEAFLEELIVRRELAINFVARNPNYDNLTGCPAWGQRTLESHALDPRPHLYQESQLESGETADDLWNAAQIEMVTTG
jgi:deoxyribodipyrimidine photo-lyase